MRALAKCLKTIMLSKLECVIIGDYYCDLANDSSPRFKLILSTLENRYRMLPKDNDFTLTLTHTSNSVSNIDHVTCTLNLSGTVSVLMGIHSTSHIPIEACANVCIPKEKRTSQWYEKKDWLKADFPLYQTMPYKTVKKINVPYNLLQANLQWNIQETKIQVYGFCAEITHALLTAEKADIPVRKIRKHPEILWVLKESRASKSVSWVYRVFMIFTIIRDPDPTILCVSVDVIPRSFVKVPGNVKPHP